MRAWHVLDEPAEVLRRVRYWDELLQRDPGAALEATRRVAHLADPTIRALAAYASARATFDTGSLDEAAKLAREAVELIRDEPVHEPRDGLGDELGDDCRHAVLMSAAVIIAEAGDVDEGLAALDRLAAGANSDPRIELQRAYVLHHAGRLNDALERLDDAERIMSDVAEPRDLMRLHSHRGLVLLQQGRLDAADADLRAAEAIAVGAGLDAARGLIVANRAVLAGRARRLVESVDLFRLAGELFAAAHNPVRAVVTAEIDRAEVMMHSGLVLDAVEAARHARDLVQPTANIVLAADAQLLVARAELAAGLTREAGHSAEAAATIFARSGRSDMVPHAHSIAIVANLRAVATPDDLLAWLHASDDLLAVLGEQGWHSLADDVSLERVRAAARVDELGRVGADLDHLRTGATSGRRDLALAGRLAEALVHRRDGALTAAIAAATAGLDRLDDIVAEAPSLEHRSAAIRLGADLSQLAIELAVELTAPDTVLAAAEGTRARALHDELASRERHRPLTVDGADHLIRELISRLGTRSLVEWVVARDRVMAVVLDRGGPRLVDVAAVRDVARARDRVLAHLDVAAADPDGSSVRAMRAVTILEEVLFEPLDLGGDGTVVMVPVDLLHGVPWSGVATLRGRPFVLTPNAQLWLDADRRAAVPARTVGLVVGPGVEGAELERSVIERRYPSAAIASGAGATATTVASMLGSYGMVHLAAHGRFRSDRPLLSTLRLDGGEATLHDIVPDRIESRLVVVSSCEGGAQGSADGSEVLGLGAVLLARGAATVIAPLTTVRDLECGEFVADVHAELAAGATAAVALATVRRRWLADDDLSRWAVASSFACFGSGMSTVDCGPHTSP